MKPNNTFINHKIENGSLSGFVKDSFFIPIEGAVVSIKCGGLHMQNISDSTGFYYIDNVPIVDCYWNVSASKNGYKTFWIEISIDQNSTYDFILTKLNKKLFVGGFGPNNYSIIQDAINNASDRDTIFVYNGTYYENIFVDKQISLIGLTDSPVIDGKGNSWCLILNKSADKCVITGFELTNTSYGIWVKSDHNLIHKNIFSDNNFGIYLHYSNSSKIKNNIIINNKRGGLKINYSHNNNVYENQILNNHLEGIWLFGSYNNSIYNNIISDNGRGIELGGYKNKIWGNLISNNTEYGIHYWATCANKIYKNNFISNNEDAAFSHIFLIGYSKIIEISWISNGCWYLNYWNESRFLPKIIVGNVRFYYDLENIESFTIQWYELDWYPAREPYDIN